ERFSDAKALERDRPALVSHDKLARSEALRARIAEISLLVALGHAREATKAAPAVLDEARALDLPRLLAGALHPVGYAAMQVADYPAAEKLLREAAVVAARAHDDPLEVATWAQLVHLLSNDMGRPADALPLVPFLEAAAARAAVDPATR